MLSFLGKKLPSLSIVKFSLQPDVAFPLQPPELQNGSARKVSLMLMHSCLHDEIDAFCKQVGGPGISFSSSFIIMIIIVIVVVLIIIKSI